MNKSLLRVTVCDGKYTFVQRANGSTYSNRYNEEWRSTTGDGLILSLAQEVDTLRELLSEAYVDLDSGMMCNPDKELLVKIQKVISDYDKDNNGRT